MPKQVDPSWPRRPPGGQWGDPAASKYYSGPPEWTPWNQDLNWRSQITKENERHIREQRDLAERLAGGATTSANVEIETAKRIFGDSNLMTKLQQRQDPDHKGLAIPPKALERALTLELANMSKQVKEAAKKLAQAQEERVAAELRATVAAAERASATRELQNLKRTVGDLRKLGRQASHALGAPAHLKTSHSQPVLGSMRGGGEGSGGGAGADPGTARSRRIVRQAHGHSGALRDDALASHRSHRSRRSEHRRRGDETGRSGAVSARSFASSVVSDVSDAHSRITRGSQFRTPRSWAGKSLDQLLAEKRAQREARASQRGQRKKRAFIEE